MMNTKWIRFSFSILLGFLLLVPVLAGLYGKTLYYYENFGSASTVLITNGWNTNYCMSRDFWNDNSAAARFTISNQSTLQRLMMWGDPNGNTAYDQWYTGKGTLFRPVSNVQLGNQNIAACEEEPFGFMIVRYGTYVHRENTNPHNLDAYGNLDPNYGKGLLEIWMAEDNGAYQFGDSFENFVFWYDKAFNRWSSSDGGSQTLSNNIWGYYNLYERDNSGYYDLNWTNLTDLDGNSMNPNSAFRRQYSWTNTAAYAQDESGTNGGACTNEMAIRMVHNGKKITIFLNLDPAGDNSGTLKNSWIKFAEAPVAWTNRLVAYFAAESPTPNAAWQDSYAQYKHFLVRSVDSNLVASIYPTNTTTNILTTFTLYITNYMGTTNESGIAEIIVKKPSSFVSNWILTNVTLSNQYGVLTNTNTNMNPPAGRYSLTTNSSGELVIRFRANTSADHQIVNSNTLVRLSFPLYSASTPNSSGDTFEVYADSYKHDDSGQDWVFDNANGIKYATTGRKKATAAFNNALLVRTYNTPLGYAGILPNRVYEGVETVYQYDIAAGNPNNNANITKAMIYIPAGFGVDTNLLYSDKMMVSNSQYLYLSNIAAGSNAVVADYDQKGLFLPASGGWDTITIKCTNTTNVPDGSSGVTVVWSSQVYSSLTLNWTNTLTNSYYPSQSLLVRKKPPLGTVSITPNVVSNTIVSNTFDVVIKNTATEDPNRIKLVRIRLPQVFTNIVSMTSASNGVITQTAGTNSDYWLIVSYTNVPPNTYIPANGGYDVIRLVMDHNVAPLSDITNVTVYADADNLNGDFFLELSEDSGGDRDIQFFTPPANAYAHIDNPGPEGGSGVGHDIYTDSDVETNLAIIIENKGEEGNHISMAKLVFPAGITNVQYVGDTKIAQWTLSNEFTNLGGGVTNSNYVLYLNYTNTLKSKIGAVSAEQDYINLKIWDAIDSPSNAHIDVYARNAKTNYSAASEVPDTTMLNYIYPPVSAKGYVSTTGGFIDWSTVTNTVDYYITNTGRTKNEILQAQIFIPSDISTNIPVTSITSTLITNAAAITYNSGVITVNYGGGGNGYKFLGGIRDRISFQMIDIVTNTVTVRLTNLVTNSRTNNILTESYSNAQNLYFQTPPVLATYQMVPNVLFVQVSNVSTDQIVFTISNQGTGNNNINQVKITSPFASSKIADIHDAVMNTNWLQAPTWVGMSGSVITLYYNNSPTNLSAGIADTLTVYLKNDYTNEQNLGWSVTADNDLSDAVPFTNLGLMSGSTNRTFIVEKAQVYADPNTVVTATYSNYIRYSLKNGTVGDANGQPIYHAKIVIIDPFTNIAGITMEQAGSCTVTNIDSSTMWILVDYTGGLQAGEADNIRFWLLDNWYVGTNYVNIASQVDYEDGGGWRDTAVESGQSTGVAFTFPPASATGYMLAGEWVPEDFTNYTYQFYIKNTGESGNDIKLVKITPPSTITNITSVTCLTKQLGGTFDGTNVWIDYAGAGKLLGSLETDTVQLVGYDNVSSGNVYSVWGVKVANTTTNDESYRVSITVPGNKSLSNIIYHPATKTSTYLEAVNSIDSSDSNKNKVWTTKTSNTFNYFIYNQSDSGNNVTKAKIFIPGGPSFFDTNSIQVTNAKGGTILLTNGMSEIWILYGSALVPGDFDAVQIKINDQYNYGETNLEWTNDTAYDTTDGRFKASLEYTGKSRKSYFVMPAPTAKSGIVNPVPREVYIKSTNFTIAYSISNTGDGTGDLFSVLLTIPAPFRSAFGTGSVSNSLATNSAYDSGTGVLSLFYSNNFKPATNDLIYLNLQGSGLTVTNFSLNCQVSNYTYASSAGDTAVNSKVLSIVNVPTYYLTPTSLSTTTASNDVNVFILNNTGGQAKLKKVVLSFTDPFNGILQTNSLVITNLGHIMGMITSLTLDYAADLNEISVGGNDAVTFRLTDSFNVGDTTAYLSAKGYNGFQWVDMDKDVGGQTNVDFVMPSADATAKINYTQMYTTVGSTNIAVSVINKGTGSNKLSKLKIYVPGGLTNLSVLSNQVYSDAITSITNSTIYVEYQNTNLVDSASTDVIWLGFSNGLSTATNISFTMDVVNLTNGSIDSRFVSAPGEGGAGALNLRVDFPAVSIQGYINGRSQFFTINTNDKLEYRIVNGSINTYLTNARIYYDTNLFTITGISNTWANAVITVTTNYVEIQYTNGIQFSQRDILTLYMNYNITNITNTMLTSSVVLYGVTNGTFNTIDAGYTQNLGVAVASWGKIKGWVYPTNFTVTAKVYYPGTSTIATNIDGALASTLTVTNGEYSFTFIPNGNYTLELSAAMFRTYRADITVNSNAENLVSIITMQNALLSPSATSNQTALCYDDNRTKVVFPSSSLTRDISINIFQVDLTQPQKDDLGNNSNVTAPGSTTGLKGFRLDVRNLDDNMMEGEVLQLDATLYLAYDPTDIASRGWSEDNLYIYYWDRITSKWVKVGGTVDKVNHYVTARVSYVHDTYGVFGGKTADGVIKNVVVRPKIFTPTKSANGYFGSVRITFELDAMQAPDGYEVKIYDMRGNLVKSFKRQGSYNQGEVAWDSKDDEGYPVKGGVYIYRVLAGGKAYSGTIVIAR